MKTLEQKLKEEGQEWLEILTQQHEPEDFNDPVRLKKVIDKMLKEGARVAKNHIMNSFDN